MTTVGEMGRRQNRENFVTRLTRAVEDVPGGDCLRLIAYWDIVSHFDRCDETLRFKLFGESDGLFSVIHYTDITFSKEYSDEQWQTFLLLLKTHIGGLMRKRGD